MNMQDPYTIFRRSDSTEDDLWRAAEALGDVSEPPTFWSSIANDPTMRPDHRALALAELTTRHVVPGTTTVAEFAQMIDGASGQEDSGVNVVTALGGKIPVRASIEDTVATIALPGDRGAIYLTIAGRWGAADVRSALRGESNPIRSAVIRDAAVETRKLNTRIIMRRLV